MPEAIKAYIYAEDGSMLGYIAYLATPPQILDLNGRMFEQRGRSIEHEDDVEIFCFDYWEMDIESVQLDVMYVCTSCGRNSSMTWWKCCPEHMDLDSPDVLCQSCVELAHPGDPEFARD